MVALATFGPYFSITSSALADINLDSPSTGPPCLVFIPSSACCWVRESCPAAVRSAPDFYLVLNLVIWNFANWAVIWYADVQHLALRDFSELGFPIDRVIPAGVFVFSIVVELLLRWRGAACGCSACAGESVRSRLLGCSGQGTGGVGGGGDDGGPPVAWFSPASRRGSSRLARHGDLAARLCDAPCEYRRVPTWRSQREASSAGCGHARSAVRGGALSIGVAPSAAAGPLDYVVHTERVQVGPYPMTVGFTVWPIRAMQSLDFPFEPDGGIADKSGTITRSHPTAGRSRRLSRHPRNRESGDWTCTPSTPRGRGHSGSRSTVRRERAPAN